MKWCFLISSHFYERKIDRHRPSLATAIGRRSDCELIVTGHGWPDYDSSLPVISNLLAMKFSPDVIWCYEQANDHLHIGVADVDCCRVMMTYDAYEIPKRKAEVWAVEPHIIFYTHENDCKRLEEIAPNARRIHTPFGVDPDIFYRPDYGERPIDCLLVGQTFEEIYPLRARWKRLIESGKIPGEVRTMPPYRLEPSECVKQYADWGAHMRRAKVVLTCGSKYKYPLQSYFAAAMSGCLVVADMPEDAAFRHGLGWHIHPVDPGRDDLGAYVRQIAGNHQAVKHTAEQTKRYALEHHTTDIMASKIVAACEAAL